MQAMKIGFGFLLVCASIVTVTGNQCENPINGVESCGKGRFFNKTEQACIPCPPFTYRDSTNHKCEDCIPCSSCEEGWISADPYGCPPDRDTRCVRADKVTDGPITRNGEGTISVTTEVLPSSSTPSCRETAQPLGHPEIKKISTLEYSFAGGQEMLIIGENFRTDCEVIIMELDDYGTSVWNGTCVIDKSLFDHKHIVCTMPPYKDDYLKLPAKVYLVITCEGGYSSQLMELPAYNPVPGDQMQNDDRPNMWLFVGGIFVGLVLLGAVFLWKRKKRQKKKRNNGQNLDGNQGDNPPGQTRSGVNQENGQLVQSENVYTDETET